MQRKERTHEMIQCMQSSELVKQQEVKLQVSVETALLKVGHPILKSLGKG